MSRLRLHKVQFLLCALCLSTLDACDKTTQSESSASAKNQYSCRYDNPFSRESECRTYYGSWTQEQVTESCETVFTGVSGTVSKESCADEDAIGICTSQPDPEGLYFKIWFYGGESEVTSRLCNEFLNGTWEGFNDSGMTPPTVTQEEVISEFLRSDDEVTVSPQCLDNECLEEMVESSEGFSFQPTQATPNVGFIIYPGARVDPRAYAPIARGIAGYGILSIIAPMPGNFALNGWERASNIMTRYPEINSWYLGGHSMGGAMTAHFAKENPGVMSGLALWAAYAGDEDNLRETSERVLSVYGELDGVVTIDEIEARKSLLPNDTLYIQVRGGNHAGFGTYGDQDGDFAADIPLSVQHNQIVGATVHFIKTIETNGTFDTDSHFTNAPTSSWCTEAQEIVAAVQMSLDTLTVINTYERTEEYALSKPSYNAEQTNPLQLSAYVREQGNATQLNAPPIMPREIWCKLKSQELLINELNATPMGEQGSCADVNQAAVDWAKEQLPEGNRAILDELNVEFVYLEDEEFETGIEWLNDGALQIEGDRSESVPSYTLRSAALKVGSQENLPEADRVPEAFRNIVYCKLIAPAEALRWLMEISDEAQ